jgi:putative phage-type endonuclease
MSTPVFHEVQQGSGEWLALRAKRFTASEAPAMMGVSPYTKRSALLRAKATGLSVDPNAAALARFAAGHAAEAVARPVAEAEIGEDLFPVTVSRVVDGLPLLASLDGLTMDESIAWEHKIWNEATAAYMTANGEPPMHHVWQLEHQMLVSGASSVLFTCSDGKDKVQHCVYRSTPDRRAALLAGWQQFRADLEIWTPEEPQAVIVAADPGTIPGLTIHVEGRVLASNLDAFRATALDMIERVPSELSTDQDFADAERAAKWCADIEDRIDTAKAAALAQTADIDALFRALDDIASSARSKRLLLSKQVKARKEAIRAEIHAAAVASVEQRRKEASDGLPDAMRVDTAETGMRIAEAMKGRKTVDSLRDAAESMAAAIKSELALASLRVRANLDVLTDAAGEYMHLFGSDLQRLCAPDVDHDSLRAVVAQRIREHEEAEAGRKARAEAAAQTVASQPVVEAKPIMPEQATITLGMIGARLGFALTRDYITTTLGVLNDSPRYTEAQWQGICSALIHHIQQVRQP